MRIADEITQQHYFEWVMVKSGVDDNGTPYGVNEGRCSCGHHLAAGESFSRHVATATALLLADILDRTAATVAALSIDRGVVSGIEIATRAIRATVEGEG